MVETIPNVALPTEARDAIWRIFGNGESPLTQRTTYDLIEPIIQGRVPSHTKGQAISQIRGWFESQENERWLKEDMREAVAAMLLSSTRDALSFPNGIEDDETLFWAVGSVEPDVAKRVICSTWSSDEIDSFVSRMLVTLNMLCRKDAVLDANRYAGIGESNAKLSMSDVPHQRMLETFRDQQDNYWLLYTGVSNMVELLVRFKLEHFYALIASVDHPVVQSFAAQCVIEASLTSDPSGPPQWISESSPDALVALAIAHTLNNVNSIELDLRKGAEPAKTPDDIEETVSSLLSSLVNRLAAIEPVGCARWIAELLNYGASTLTSHSQGEKPRRLEQLEKACVQLVARLVCQSGSNELLAELRVGFCLTPLTPRTLPLAEVVWEIREAQPERAAEISRMVIDTHEEVIAEALAGNRTLFYSATSWQDGDWLIGLGVALALSYDDFDPSEWVSRQCQALPLSVWDAEENPVGFRIADKVAQLRFLVVLHAAQTLRDAGRGLDPAEICTLVEKLWAHCHFAELHVSGQPVGSETSEYAARVAVELANPSDVWVLEQARKPDVNPRTLWALIDQRVSRKPKETGTGAQQDEMVTEELRGLASARFSNLRGFGLEELHYLGQLWILLDAPEQAEETAMAMIALQKPNRLRRIYDVLALKLLAFSASKQGSAPWIKKEIAVLYRQLWSSFTPAEERTLRQEVDSLLK